MTEENNGWISVDEKLPENEQIVLTYRNSYKYGDLYTQAIYTENKGFIKYPISVAGKPPTHWQPLSPPPNK